MRVQQFLISVLFSLTCFLVVPVTASAAQTQAPNDGITSAYLKSIHEDCRLFIEGIELFVRRDYPQLWPQILASDATAEKEVTRYIKEVKQFQRMLDALFMEYASYKKNQIHDSSQPKTASNGVETEILQMLAFAYLRTGDFCMAKAIIGNGEVLSKETTISLIDLEGTERNFQLSQNLKRLADFMDKELEVITIDLVNMFPENLSETQAFLTISDKRRRSPLETAYLAYYGGTFPGLKQEGGKFIHLSEIHHFYNRLNKNPVTAETELARQETTFLFPIVKGSYRLESQDAHIRITQKHANMFEISHLCHFKGFVRTDFRLLKNAEKNLMEEKPIVDNGLLLVNGENSYAPGTWLPYDVYTLTQNNTPVGEISLVACFQDMNCEPEQTTKTATTVKVFNHQLMLFQDILDLAKRNAEPVAALPEEMAGHDASPDPDQMADAASSQEEEEEAAGSADVTTPRENGGFHLFRGCAPSAAPSAP